jgi:hypothetical protein
LVNWVILLDQHPEEQDESSPDPKVQGHGLADEAAVELMNVVALSEQALRFLAQGKRHVQVTCQTAACAHWRK